MKKYISIILAALMAASLASCSKSEPQSTTAPVDNTVSTTVSTADTPAPVAPEETAVEDVFNPSVSDTAGAYATIKISSDVKMDDESAWLGLCPAGYVYTTELEADEQDVIWFNADYRENESDPYVFACDFNSVEDGQYALVVATSDDENIGYVVIQLEMTKSGDKLTFDYSSARLNERPQN